ncbi:leucyl aminopeptidase [Agromyces protaetiae]|uniref:Probable cytosol aminopeptidase n=1 Tax=Agromyces protaetiae TaxID=2509455 RepID=A0A4P6F9D7_9MICO|nr:leucyl aminopeptidase [Agromyces protaetiae]QAY72502.1 leucyl aminopeptidase [Agromyces protaetiae]
MTRSPYKLIPDGFTPIPSLAAFDAVSIFVTDASTPSPAAKVDAVGVLVSADDDLSAALGLDESVLKQLGFEAKPGTTLALPRASAGLSVAVGVGAAADIDTKVLRSAAAAFVRAVPKAARVALTLSTAGSVGPRAAAAALVEGALLGRYRYDALKGEPREPALTRLELRFGEASGFTGDGPLEQATAGTTEGLVTARAAAVARDLANTPPGHLTASDFADVAVALGERFGFDVEVFDKAALIDLGIGGLLGVNAASAEEPRMIKLEYTPAGEASGHLGLVGKGIMYDSGGISLKPSDPMHLLMKMDMGGAAAILGTFTALSSSGGTAEVTAWLMCTDNMPSGSAYKLGDVLHVRGGKTVEVKNTDAEGRLAMMDALVLATEAGVDAIIDIATLTGAALMALGPALAAVIGNDAALVDLIEAAGSEVDERVWELPLERSYRKQLDSDVADLSNLGGPYAGATTAALFLAEFVGETPWAHLDIAGTMQSDADDAWKSKGATGWGARLLFEVARDYVPPYRPGE